MATKQPAVRHRTDAVYGTGNHIIYTSTNMAAASR